MYKLWKKILDREINCKRLIMTKRVSWSFEDKLPWQEEICLGNIISHHLNLDICNKIINMVYDSYIRDIENAKNDYICHWLDDLNLYQDEIFFNR